VAKMQRNIRKPLRIYCRAEAGRTGIALDRYRAMPKERAAASFLVWRYWPAMGQ
jgi:hypothetical protein